MQQIVSDIFSHFLYLFEVQRFDNVSKAFESQVIQTEGGQVTDNCGITQHMDTQSYCVVYLLSITSKCSQLTNQLAPISSP